MLQSLYIKQQSMDIKILFYELFFLKVDISYYFICQLLATGRWFSLDSLVSSTNKTDRHDITEILLKVALNTMNQPTNHNISK
jgi:hypothetical protein